MVNWGSLSMLLNCQKQSKRRPKPHVATPCSEQPSTYALNPPCFRVLARKEHTDELGNTQHFVTFTEDEGKSCRVAVFATSEDADEFVFQKTQMAMADKARAEKEDKE